MRPRGFRRLILITVLLCFGLSTAGCSSVLFVKDPKSRIFTDATFESSKPFFFFGLIGPTYDVYVDQICLGKGIDQVSTVYTGHDLLASIFSLGIYVPRTVRVWCSL